MAGSLDRPFTPTKDLNEVRVEDSYLDVLSSTPRIQRPLMTDLVKIYYDRNCNLRSQTHILFYRSILTVTQFGQ